MITVYNMYLHYSWTDVSSRYRFILPAEIFADNNNQYIYTNILATDTDTNIFISTDIWPITDILVDICQYFGRYPSNLANI